MNQILPLDEDVVCYENLVNILETYEDIDQDDGCYVTKNGVKILL